MNLRTYQAESTTGGMIAYRMLGKKPMTGAVSVLADANAEAPEFVGMPRFYQWGKDIVGIDTDGTVYLWEAAK